MRVRRIVLAVALVGSGLAVSLVTSATPASADIQPTGYVNQIFPTSSARTGSAMCVDVPGSTSAYGAQLVQYGCSGNSNQSWRMEARNGGYQIVSNLNNLCWDVWNFSTQWGGIIAQYACTGGTNQIFNKVDNAVGTMSIVSAYSGLCVDIGGYGANWSAGVIQWPCLLSDNQMFTTTTRPSFGYIDEIVGTDTGIKISGWTIAANAPGYQLAYQVGVNGQVVNAPYSFAQEYRPDVGAGYPGVGNYRGISREFDLNLPPGNLYSICVQSQSYGLYSNIRCGRVGLQVSGQSIAGGPPSQNAHIDGCRLVVPRPLTGFYDPIKIEDQGVVGGAPINYGYVVPIAMGLWGAKMPQFTYTQGGVGDRGIRVKTVLTMIDAATTRNYCGGILQIGLYADRVQMKINGTYFANQTAIQRTNTMMHEIGHAFSLDHPTVPVDDKNSYRDCIYTVMNAVAGCPQPTGYFPTANDISIVQSLYPS
jgi:Ricin-type beta-trefoil lectin domain